MNKINLLEIAKNAISTEIAELQYLKNRLNEDFEKAVNIIHKSQGKLVVVGIGKSAHMYI